MENQQQSQKNYIVSNGILLGLVSVLFSVLLYVTGMQMEGAYWPMYIFYLVFMLAIGYFIYNYREKNNGFLSLSRALKVGVGIAVVCGIVGVLYNLVFMNFIEPDYQAQMLEVSREKALEANPNMTEEELELTIGISEKFTGPFVLSAFTLIAHAFFGFIYSLISGLIFKREQQVQY